MISPSRFSASLFTWSLLSAVVFAYERCLVPLYGSVPTNLHLRQIILAVMTAATFTPFHTIRAITPNPMAPANFFIFAAPLLSMLPSSAYWAAAQTARLRDPWLGPLVTHLIVLSPIVYFFAVSSLGMSLADLSGLNFVYRFLAVSWAPSIVWLSFQLCLATFGIYPSHLISIYSNDQISNSVAVIIIAAWIILRINAHCSHISQTRTRAAHFFQIASAFGVLLGLIPVFLPSRRPSPRPCPLLQPYTHPVHPLKILFSSQSTTGVIVVGDLLRLPSNQDDTQLHSLRYLRASHSLLGGVWLGDNIASIDGTPSTFDEEGTPLGDSIYSAFVLQEATRLVQRTERPKDDNRKNALIIGLGAGISASAFRKHNISTTIVEIDPAVYEAARHYFGMPDPGPGKVFLEDARGWVAKRASRARKDVIETSFDIVIHDCFSGGGVPEHIFTTGFWQDLKMIIDPNGVVAVNFAGKLGSDASRAILLTLQSVFRSCRVFHDSLQPLSEEQDSAQFMNIVFFCTLGPSPMTFRPARHSDYLNSHLRQLVLSSIPDREINLTLVTGDLTGLTVEEKNKWILSDNHNPLGRWEEKAALEHWKLMREVMPDWVWETY